MLQCLLSQSTKTPPSPPSTDIDIQTTSHTQHINSVPWIEKYRPTKFKNIVLDPINRNLFQNILDKNYFPNLLFYGTPGTGKTTTIINLINEYQSRYNKNAKGSIIHLNASDERGIDIIRNNINQFVKSKNLFETGCKFIILDEVDYMTKNAQQALKYLIQTTNNYVHYCLICNYISKIDEPLQNEFICVRFNHLPKIEIHRFIKNITEKENIQLPDNTIDTILDIYKSDIRSIINYIQLNHTYGQCDDDDDDRPTNMNWTNNIINADVWRTLHTLLLYPLRVSCKCKESIIDLTEIHDTEYSIDTELHVEPNITNVIKQIHIFSIKYNMNKKNIIQTYFNYIIRHSNEFQVFDSVDMKNEIGRNIITHRMMVLIEYIIHSNDTKSDLVVGYFATFLRKYYMEIYR